MCICGTSGSCAVSGACKVGTGVHDAQVANDFPDDETTGGSSLDGLSVEGIVFWLLIVGGGLSAFIYAHVQRGKMLEDARAGRLVVPPSACWKYSCGACAIYYWEGCGSSYVIQLCLTNFYAVCCWNQSAHPMENGILVGPPVAAGVVIKGPQQGVDGPVQGQAAAVMQIEP